MEITAQMKKPRVTIKFSLLVFIGIMLLGAGLSGCDRNRVYDVNKELPEAGWNSKDKIGFEVNIDDSLAPHNIYMNIRHKSDYQWANIYMFLYTTYPDGNFSKDTFECILADDKGKWLGKGMGDIKSLQLTFMKNFRFKKGGKYKFEFQQAMRTENLIGIVDIGMRVEKSK